MWLFFKFPQLHYFPGSTCCTNVFWTLSVSCTAKQSTETCFSGKTSSYSALVSSFTTFGTYIDCFSKSHKNRRLMSNVSTFLKDRSLFYFVNREQLFPDTSWSCSECPNRFTRLIPVDFELQNSF